MANAASRTEVQLSLQSALLHPVSDTEGLVCALSPDCLASPSCVLPSYYIQDMIPWPLTLRGGGGKKGKSMIA